MTKLLLSSQRRQPNPKDVYDLAKGTLRTTFMRHSTKKFDRAQSFLLQMCLSTLSKSPHPPASDELRARGQLTGTVAVLWPVESVSGTGARDENDSLNGGPKQTRLLLRIFKPMDHRESTRSWTPTDLKSQLP
mmetsp:Transcript_60896/g.143858  ORF Transcript_60896/g.143858 Transcript_60896/m.143858 type:complete len:133 (-) Transcript_60896:1339-1737(-)